MLEIWRPIAGFDGLYQVSNLGRVRSLPGGHRRGCVLSAKLPRSPRAYMTVSLHDGGRRVRRAVHSLVASAFLGERPSPLHEVRHLTGDRARNEAHNLAWGTRRQNAQDRDRHGTTARGSRHGMFGKRAPGEINPNAALSNADAESIRDRVASGEPQRSVARDFGVNQATVWRIAHGLRYGAALKARQATTSPDPQS